MSLKVVVRRPTEDIQCGLEHYDPCSLPFILQFAKMGFCMILNINVFASVLRLIKFIKTPDYYHYMSGDIFWAEYGLVIPQVLDSHEHLEFERDQVNPPNRVSCRSKLAATGNVEIPAESKCNISMERIRYVV